MVLVAIPQAESSFETGITHEQLMEAMRIEEAEMRRDTASFVSGVLSADQIAPVFETDTPYLQTLEAMLKKKQAPLIERSLDQTANYMPVLSTRQLSPSVREVFKPTGRGEPLPLRKGEPADLVRPRLLITSSFLAEIYELFLQKDTITLGEADSNDIVLSGDYMTAPHHALIKNQRGEYHLFERRSKGGVFVNGHKLVSGLGFKLSNGDEIVIGQYHLTFANTPMQDLTRPVVSASIARRVALPKMLNLPTKTRV